MAQRQGKRKRYPQAYWQAHIRKQQESGLSRAEYCRQHHLSYHALTYWDHKLSRSFQYSGALVPVPMRKIIGQAPATEQGAGIKILLGSDIAIEVSEHFSPSALTRVLSVLEGR